MRRRYWAILILAWLFMPSIVNSAVLLANDPLFPLGLGNVMIEGGLALLLIPLAFPVVVFQQALWVGLYYGVSIVVFVVYLKRDRFVDALTPQS
jgi:hypothetical protein